MKKSIIFVLIVAINSYADNLNIDLKTSNTVIKENKSDGLTSAQRHKKMCDELGGTEATGETDVISGAGTIDSGVCIKKLESSKSNIHSIHNIQLDIANPYLYLAAPAGSVPYPSQFNVSGIAVYRDFPAGRVFWQLGIPDDNCYRSGALTITGDYQVNPWMLCSTVVKANVQSYMKGCFNDQCYHAYGNINQGV